MKNRYLSALGESYNVLGLAGVAALSMAAITTPIAIPVILAGLVLEAAYLIFVPDSKWYEKRLARRYDEEILARREQVKNQTLPQLRPSLQTRFEKLETMRAQIDRQAAGDAVWMREVLRKLDFLLEKFLQFALKDEQFRTYLYETRRESESSRNLRLNSGARPLEPTDRWLRETVDYLQNDYANDIAGVESQFEGENDENTKAILTKRLEVLKRRRDFIGRIGKIVVNLSQQLSLLEDTFGLISDELLARPPEQVLGDIEDVVSQTNTMTQVLEELAPYERMLSSG